MSEIMDKDLEQCGCRSSPTFPEIGECAVCAPKMALSLEEEAILTQMRSIKTRVRPIADRLKEIGNAIEKSGTVNSQDKASEWNSLSTQLEDLRYQWKTWELRLEEAIEHKLVLLGHRRPKS